MPLKKRPSNKSTDKSAEKQFDQAGPLLQLANRYLWIFCGIIALVILSVGYLMFISPYLDTVRSKADDRLPQKEQALSELQNIEKKLTLLEAKFNQVKSEQRSQLDKLYTVLPLQPDYASLFVQAQFLAENNQIELKSIDITREAEAALTQRRDAVENNSTEAALVKGQENVRSLTLTMQFGEATYTGFKTYLEDLEKHLRLFDVQSVSLGSVDPETGALGGFNLVIRTYYKYLANE